MTEFNKLVRDKIPEILRKKKIKYKFHKANNKEYIEMLYKKLIEELEEFKKEPNVEEFCDMLQVLENIGKFHDLEIEEVKEVKKIKKEISGGFDKKIILESTD